MNYLTLITPLFCLIIALSTRAAIPIDIKKDREIILNEETLAAFIKNYVDTDAMMEVIKADNFLKRLYPFYLAKELAAGHSGSLPEVIGATLVGYHYNLRKVFEVGQFEYESRFIYSTLHIYVQELRPTDLQTLKTFKDFLKRSPKLILLPQYQGKFTISWRKGDDKLSFKINPNVKLYEVRRILRDFEEQVGVKSKFPFEEVDRYFKSIVPNHTSCADLLAAVIL